MRAAAWFAAGIGVCIATAAYADTLYVVETLMVNVSTTPDGSGERVATIRSGDRVEQLERQGDQTKVHVANGAEGWVKSSYLSAEPPLRQRLDERTAELEKTKQRVEQLESELTQARLIASSRPPPQAAPPPSAPAPPPPQAAEPAPERVTAPTATHTVFPDVNPQGRPTWKWIIGSSAFCLFAGFVFGWRTLDRRIRRKYGGLRIY
jgi:hypothetical protein